MTKKTIVKTIMSMSVMEAGIYLYYITINYTPNSVPPIGDLEGVSYVDPVPSALMITAIGLTMFMHYKQKHGITHWTRYRDQLGSEE